MSWQERVEQTYLDRSLWGSGLWDSEPDRVLWVDEETGMQCLMRRGDGGAWCGYVGVEPGHPWHGEDFDVWESKLPFPEVHGGITYSSPCQEDNKERGICHVPAPGQAEHLFWQGFDCRHHGDSSPERDWGGTYRTMGYVRGQVEHLARQAAEIAQSSEPEGA